MGLSESMRQAQAHDAAFKTEQKAKLGEYDNSEAGCPNYGRHRVMIGIDGKRRCEKCAWCIEDGARDSDMLSYLKTQ